MKPSTNVGSVLGAAHHYCAGLGIEMRMSRRCVPEADLSAMADEAFAIKRLIDNHPRALNIYRSAF